MDASLARYLAERRTEAEGLLEERDGVLTLRADVAHFGCPYCGLTGGKVYTGTLSANALGYTYRQCGTCGIVYPYPRLNAEGLRRRATCSAINAFVARSLANEPEQVAPPFPAALFRGLAGRDVLEVGPGAGRVLRFLRSIGARPIGVEPNLEAARFCRAVGCSIIQDFFEEELLLRDTLVPGTFDAVIFWESLYHLFSVRDALKLARALLREGGLLVVKAFDIESFYLRYFLPASRGIDGMSIPTNASAATYRRIIEREGFVVRRVYRHAGSVLDQVGFHWPAMRRRSTRRILRVLDMAAYRILRLLGPSRNFVLLAEKV